MACATALALTGCNSAGHPDATNGPTTTPAPTTCSTTHAAAFDGTALPFGSKAPTGPSSALEISAGLPHVSSVPSGQAGYRLVQVPVHAAVRTNGTFAIDHGQFELVDRSGRICKQPAINPLPSGFVTLTVDEADAGSGLVAFLVPTSVAADRLRIRYLPATGSSMASLSWQSDAPAPPPEKAADACDGKKSTYSTQKADRVGFGTTVTTGDKVVSTEVRAGTPKRRAFKPGPSQPNTMDAIDIRLRVTAHGADAYVDRRAFVLVDGTGRLCRSSALSSQGETLTSALVKKGHSADYTIVFWAPKGSAIHGLQLLQLTKPGSTKVQSVWSAGKLTLKPLRD